LATARRSLKPPRALPGRDEAPLRLLVLNQYYAPGIEATAQLLAQLCRALARDYDVRVVTGRLAAPGGDPGSAWEDGVQVVRVRSTAFPRRRIPLRALNYLTFLAAALWKASSGPRPDAVLCMTDPPVIGNLARLVARRFGVPLVVVCQDVHPEISVRLRRVDNPVAVAALGRAVRSALTRADRVVAIGDTMRARLEAKGVRPERLRVIPNWADTAELTERPRDNGWARGHGLTGRFVVMHSGNVGHAQDLDTLIRAAVELEGLERLSVVVIGHGARRDELVALARQLRAGRVSFLPYQPRAALPFVLSSADVHVVGLAHGLAGYVVPSRLYGVLAAGRAVIAAADPESETAQLVSEVGCGVVVPPGRPDVLAAELRRAHAGQLDLDEMGRRGREYVSRAADLRVAADRYRAVVSEVVGMGAP
jgi:colanic acid biosynthesis glycosyl transferase WcaI